MADMGITEVSAMVQATVSDLVQEYLIQESVLIERVTNYPSKKGEDRVAIPRSNTALTADTKAENTSVTAQVITYAVDSLLLDKHKAIQIRIEDKASISSMVDLMSDIVPRMVKTLALDVDTQIVSELTTGVSTAAPDHKLAYANASTLGKADILSARQLLHEQNVKFSECYIGVSPKSESDLLAISDFVSSDVYGSSRGLVNGELGTLYGAKVIMSNEFADAETMVWHPSAIAFSRQMEPKFEMDRDVPNLANLISLSHLYGVKCLDSGLRQVLLGTAV